MTIIRFLYWIVELIEKRWNATNENAATFLEKTGREDVHAAIRARVRLKRKRIILLTIRSIFLIIITVITGYLAFILFSDDESGFWSYVLGVVFLISAFSAFISLFSEGIGNISTIESSDVLKQTVPFALYLRAFASDNRRTNFKEEELVQTLLDCNITTYAVGLPEEVDASLGALRVYVNNETWQEEVQLMMERASYLFLRVCNTEPSLWELEQALSLHKELYIIVDDVDDYNAVCSKFQFLPKVDTIKPGRFSIFQRKEDGSWEYIDPYPEDTYVEKIQQEKFYQDAYVESLLDQFPIPQEADMREYEKNIQGLFSNTMMNFEHNKNILVAERIIGLMEVYYSKGNNEKRVLTNIQIYLKMFDRFSPFPEELQLRRDELLEKTRTTKDSNQ